MATKLTKPVTRETDVTHFEKGHRNIIVTLQGDCIVFKLKGMKTKHMLPIADAYHSAWSNTYADQLKALHRGKRK